MTAYVIDDHPELSDEEHDALGALARECIRVCVDGEIVLEPIDNFFFNLGAIPLRGEDTAEALASVLTLALERAYAAGKAAGAAQNGTAS